VEDGDSRKGSKRTMNPDEGKEQRDRWEDSPWPQHFVADGITSSAFAGPTFLHSASYLRFQKNKADKGASSII